MAPRNADRDIDDDAPWLAEAGAPRTIVSKRSLFWTSLIGLGLMAIIAVGLILLLSKKHGGSTPGFMNAEQAPLIAAAPGPYKIAPIDPKGLAVEGQDQTIYAAGEGIDAGSVIDQSAMPEAPMPRPGSGPAITAGSEPAAPPAAPPGLPRDLIPRATPSATPSATTAIPTIAVPAPAAIPTFTPATPEQKPVIPRAAPVAKPVTPRAAPEKPVLPKAVAATPAPAKAAAIVSARPVAEPTKPAPTPAAKKSGTVQLGAFSSEEKANAAWASLATKHGMGAFSKRVIPVESNGKTLYRLRGSGGDSAEICQKLKASGDACAVVE